MVKVCHMTSAHAPEDERIFFKEGMSLAANGYETYLVARGNSYEKNGVHIIGVGDIPQSRRKRMTEGAKKVYEAARAVDADIYHFHDPELLPYGLKLKKAGKKVIFDSHEDTAQQIMEKTWIPAIIRVPTYHAFVSYQRHICRQLDAVISVTPHICDSFRPFSKRVEMITNYPGLEPLPDRSSSRPNTLCFAGGIAEQWCHQEILSALERCPDSTYVLCGDLDSVYGQALRQMPGWKQVEYVGRIPHEQVHMLLGNCSVGISLLKPGRNTGFQLGTMGNTKIFEEMMAGLPVVCTNFTLWKEFVDRYHCGICVDPTNVDEIAKAIRYLLDHPDEARQMGENGRRAVKEEFNWRVEEMKLLALYEKVED